MWLPLLLSVLTVGSISCEIFTATISTLDQYEVGKDITCKVVITNNDDKDYYLLRRNTPLDKLASHTFQITQNGSLVPYDGLLYQRIPPTSEDFILVVAKSSVSLSVDLSQYYSLKTNANYKIMLKTIITYYEHSISKMKSHSLSSNYQSFTIYGDSLKMMLTEAAVVRSSEPSLEDSLVSVSTPGVCNLPSFGGTPISGDISSTSFAFGKLCQHLGVCKTNVNINLDLYTQWFGLRYAGYVNTVRGAFYDIKDALETYKYTIHFDGPVCATNAGIIAYTSKRSTTIYVCQAYRRNPDINGYNSKLGTLIHELSHAIAFTDDLVYGTYECKELAKSQPELAIRNADNYEYFSEALKVI